MDRGFARSEHVADHLGSLRADEHHVGVYLGLQDVQPRMDDVQGRSDHQYSTISQKTKERSI